LHQEQSGGLSIIFAELAEVMRMGSVAIVTLALSALLFSSSAHAQVGERSPIEWRTFEVPEFGTRVLVPASIFIPAGKPKRGSGQKFERADGRAVLSIYSRPNDTGENPATYLRHNLRMDRSALDYARVARSFFAISSERQGIILYSRCNFSRRAIHCFDLTYPQEEKRAWDAVVTRISLSLRPLEG
jgi:hypothetical protein